MTARLPLFGSVSTLALLTLALPMAGHAAPAPHAAATAPAAAPSAVPGGVAPERLVETMRLAADRFTLANGLTVIVHTDRSAPLVAINVRYKVGAMNEPAGKSGFAHLYEHLMFSGSENADGDFFGRMKDMGASGVNGGTGNDTTTYFETVPTAGLERALYIESDRMGYLLGAITRHKLDVQRGVVQNEKRQGDNRPYGMVQYAETENLYPADHPYGHTVIGSMADLDAASVDTVKDWFRAHYGPNNAVLTLAGDIDTATARTLAERYFGAIARGPQSVTPPATVPVLPAARTVTLHDTVPNAVLRRSWPVPGMDGADSGALDLAATILGGSDSSRLVQALVSREKLALAVQVGYAAMAHGGTFGISMVPAPGVDHARLLARVDALLRDFMASGPTRAEIDRAVTNQALQSLRSMDDVGTQAALLADGQFYGGDPDFLRARLAGMARLSPAQVCAGVSRWLRHPALTVSVVPGARPAYVEAASQPAAPMVSAAVAAEPAATATRAAMPPLAPAAPLQVPTTEHARLANGMMLDYVQRQATPMTEITVALRAGQPAGAPGVQDLALAIMQQRTALLDSHAFALAKDNLGIAFTAATNEDQTLIDVEAPSANLAGAAGLLGEALAHPGYASDEFARLRQIEVSGAQESEATPNTMARRAMAPLLFGQHRYAATGGAPSAALATLTPQDLQGFHDAWIRPDLARVFVVSDRPLAEIVATLDRALAPWQAHGPAGTWSTAPATPATPRIVLIDRPGTPQSLIMGGVPTPVNGLADTLPMWVANNGLGEDFLARINMDLREDKHWTYGANGRFRIARDAAPYVVSTSVQADKTGAALAELRTLMADFVTRAPLTQAEFTRAVNGGINEMPGNFASRSSIVAVLSRNARLDRPDDYYARLPDRLRAMTRQEAQAAFQAAVDPARAIWVVVGDAAQVLPQLEGLGLPVERRAAQPASGG